MGTGYQDKGRQLYRREKNTGNWEEKSPGMNIRKNEATRLKMIKEGKM